MTKSSLTPGQRQILELIEALGFGVIERLLIRGGLPLYEPEPQIIQAIKLDSVPDQQSVCIRGDLTLKKEFESLFNHLSRLRDGIVDIEVRHGVPIRLLIQRSCEDVVR